jgi:hypothetical protein
MVGHDTRNPLQAITGELYLAKSEVESLAEGEAKNNLQESIQVIESKPFTWTRLFLTCKHSCDPVKVDKKTNQRKRTRQRRLSNGCYPK